MHRRPFVFAPTTLLASWFSAAAAVPAVLLVAAAGQGVGTVLAGGGWIGLSLPWSRQAWALVNQPALNFAALPSGSGYWLGSVLAPALVAGLVIPAGLRVATVTGQLLVVQTAWIAVVVGVAWQPNLVAESSHIARWLHFRGLPLELRFIGTALAVGLVVPIVLRVLAVARITRFHLGRGGRLAVVTVHLLPVPLAWCAATTRFAQELPVVGSLVTAAPLVAAALVAWVGYPAPLTHAVEGTRAGELVALAAAVALGLSLLWFAGRPLPGDRFAALQWGRDTATNNIRRWMAPSRAPWLPPAELRPAAGDGGMTATRP